MIVLGLTGGIGMGKSTVSRMFERNLVPVWDADACVHFGYSSDFDVQGFMRIAFPQVWRNAQIDRSILRDVLFRDSEAMRVLNWTMGRYLDRSVQNFISLHKATRTQEVVILDVPLLYESGMDSLCDYTVAVSCPEAVQRERVMARPGMTEATYLEFTSRQMSDNQRCAKADYVIDTSLALDTVERRILNILSCAKTRASQM